MKDNKSMEDNMKDRSEFKKENNKDFIKKGVKTQNQVSKNQFVTTIEEPALNESAFDKHKVSH